MSCVGEPGDPPAAQTVPERALRGKGKKRKKIEKTSCLTQGFDLGSIDQGVTMAAHNRRRDDISFPVKLPARGTTIQLECTGNQHKRSISFAAWPAGTDSQTQFEDKTHPDQRAAFC